MVRSGRIAHREVDLRGNHCGNQIAMARPTIPPTRREMYMSAVSKKLMPASTARLMNRLPRFFRILEVRHAGLP